MKKITVILIALLIGLSVGTALAYYEMSYGSARSMGMGNAMTAVDGSADSALYNPAALGALPSGHLNAYYLPLMMGLDRGGLSFFHASVAYPINETAGTLGAVFNSLSSKDLYSESQVIVSYGKAFNIGIPMFAVGVNAKLQSVAFKDDPILEEDLKKMGFDLDAGVYAGVTPNITLGVSVQNIIGSDLAVETSGSKVPMRINAGAAYMLLANGDVFNDLTIAVSTVIPIENTDTLTYHFGVETTLIKILKVRAGYDYNGITFGVGYEGSSFGAGIAMKYNIVGEFNNMNLNMGISYFFSPPEKSWRLDAMEAAAHPGHSEYTSQATMDDDDSNADTATGDRYVQQRIKELEEQIAELEVKQKEAAANRDFVLAGQLQEEIDELKNELDSLQE